METILSMPVMQMSVITVISYRWFSFKPDSLSEILTIANLQHATETAYNLSRRFAEWSCVLMNTTKSQIALLFYPDIKIVKVTY